MIKIPEQGQLAKVRGRFFIVHDVKEHVEESASAPFHRVSLECIDDEKLGDELEVVWELEINPVPYDTINLPEPTDWDTHKQFKAFLHSIEWSANSFIDNAGIQAPFRGAIELEDYQLEPVARALSMPRVNLLLADDVGLGKTIEAGLVIQELLSKQRIRRILIVCPASLQKQWQEEMLDKFALRFEIIDREEIQGLRKEYGIHVNPWNSFPRLITSMDYIKREQPLAQFTRPFWEKDKDKPIRDWDLLIVDEAHNVAPSGRKSYIRDSDRTKMMKAIAPLFEHRLFLTATPHNGYTESYTALLELLDPLRFTRGTTVDKVQADLVRVRRLKDDIEDEIGNKKFTKRRVDPIVVDPSDKERRLHELLAQYSESRLQRARNEDYLPVRFALTMLKKRLLSSPLAFANSLEVHKNNLPESSGPQVEKDIALVQQLATKSEADWDDDESKSRYEDDVLQESSRFFANLTSDENKWLQEMTAVSSEMSGKSDRKLTALLDWINEKLLSDKKWTRERLIIFTEYKDTLEYIKKAFAENDFGGRVTLLYGGMKSTDREAIKNAFQASPDENEIRILLATDAASEGLNLQKHCRYLIHYEIPWNPNKMEQRNGRIDRHGQKRDVFVYHFLYKNHEDSEFLEKMIDKVKTIRYDLGSMGEIINKQVEEAMLGLRKEIELPEERRKKIQDELKSDVNLKMRIRELGRQIKDAEQKWDLQPDNLRIVLDEALKLADHSNPGLETAEAADLAGKAFYLKKLPPGWAECRPSIHDNKGRLLKIVFDREAARDRNDVSLIHLNHPLMRRAIGVFRSNLWSEKLTETQKLQRASYQVLQDAALQKPVIIVFGRIVATGKYGQILHEAVVPIGGEFDKGDLFPLPVEQLKTQLSQTGSHPEISTSLGSAIRRFYPQHQVKLKNEIKTLEKEEEKQLRRKLKEYTAENVKTVKTLIKDRIAELEIRIKEASATRVQLVLQFDEEEMEQYDDDLRWFEHKLTELKNDLEREPQLIAERLTLKSVRVFPIGLLYLLPERLVKEDS